MKEKMRFKIRRADKGDVPQIVENWNQLMHSHVRFRAKFYKIKADAEKLYLRFLKKQMKSRKATVFVAESRGQIIGHVMVGIVHVPPVYEIDKQCGVYEIFVRRGFRKKGIGTALFRAAEEWAKRRKIKHAALTVDIKNRDALDLYGSLGYAAYQLKMIKMI
jgi:GNAT superfamily N-acetyltransferase